MGVGDGEHSATVTNAMPQRKKPPRKDHPGYTRAGKESLGEKKHEASMVAEGKT
jgi:hypothetical protein